MKKAMLAMIVLAGSALADPRVAVGFGLSAPAPVVIVRPACPGPGYVWVGGYHGATGIWVPGFWRAPVMGIAVGPRFADQRHFAYRPGRDFNREFRRY